MDITPSRNGWLQRSNNVKSNPAAQLASM